MKKRILIFTATYNEVEMIKYYFNELYKLNFIFDLLIIDDNSPDFTWKELEKLQKIHKNFKLIIREKKLGLYYWYDEHDSTWAPPQNSTEQSYHASFDGFSRSSLTVAPILTTRTGSGYCSPKTARTPFISFALSSETSFASTMESALMDLFTSC